MTDDAERSGMSEEKLKAWRRRENDEYIEIIKRRANDGTGRGGVAFDHAVSKIVNEGDSLNYSALSADELELIGEGLYGPTMMFGPTTRARLRGLSPRVADGPLAGAIFPYPCEKMAGFNDLRLAVLASDMRMPAIQEKSAIGRKKPLQDAVKRHRDELMSMFRGKALAVAILDALNREREAVGIKPLALSTVQKTLSLLRE